MIYRGDQYYLQFTITDEEKNITPDDISGLKLKIENIEFEFPDKGIEYDFEEDKWKCFLSKGQTANLEKVVEIQVQVIVDDYIKHTEIKKVPIHRTLFSGGNVCR